MRFIDSQIVIAEAEDKAYIARMKANGVSATHIRNFRKVRKKALALFRNNLEYLDTKTPEQIESALIKVCGKNPLDK